MWQGSCRVGKGIVMAMRSERWGRDSSGDEVGASKSWKGPSILL